MVRNTVVASVALVVAAAAALAQTGIFEDDFETGTLQAWSCSSSTICSTDPGFSMTAVDESSASWVQVFDTSMDGSGNVFVTFVGFDSCDGRQIIVNTICDSAIKHHCLALAEFDILFSVSGSDPDPNSDFPTLYVTKSFTAGKPLVPVVP